MTAITDADAETLARRVNRRELDPIDVAEAFAARILERSASLMALVNYFPDAVRNDAARVRDRVRAGETLPLAGVPVVIKDNIWVKGYRITQGSRSFADFIAPADAIAVERLRAAGAVVIGIGACPEFACTGMTKSPLYGPTRHPADPRLTPGGSSGGNAVALAEGMAPLAIGTDAGGSGRRPAAHCGVVGFKPSQGAIPYGPGFAEPFVGTCVMSPMGRTVGDVSLLFAALAGPDLRDPESMTLPADQPSRPPRIAYSPRFGLDVPVDPDVVVCVETAIARLRASGLVIERVDPVWPAGAAETGLTAIHEAGLAQIHGAAWQATPDRFDPVVGAQIQSGLRRTGAEVAAALALSAAVRKSVAAFFGDYDLLIGPTAPCVSWPHDRLGPEFIGGVPVPPRGHAVFTPLFNHAQVPAISIPCGTGRDGLPVGLQIVGPRGADRRVLDFAARIERIVAGA
jgi:aspartyl-tRNA(Asn)/glutamyl-tRNA(Gln) amidotransferase subunit A